MRPSDNIEKLFRQTNIETNADVDKVVLGDAVNAMSKSKQSKPGIVRPDIWRIIMKSKMTKFAAAAVIIIAVLVGINQFGSSIDGSSVAWGQVITRTNQIDHVHLYILQFANGDMYDMADGWYAHGKYLARFQKRIVYDDTKMQYTLDRNYNYTSEQPSPFVNGGNIFNIAGLIDEGNEQFAQQLPTNIADDFFIYILKPPDRYRDYIENISVMVGINSLLPIQVKVLHKNRGDTYDVWIFDYETPAKSPEFFELPTVGKSHGAGEVVLDGEEVMIDIGNVPGLKSAVVSLQSTSKKESESELFEHAIFSGADKSKVLSVYFITGEGYKSSTLSFLPFKLDRGTKIGVGANNWPDGKYRNISGTLVPRATDRKNVYTIEVSCWINTDE